MNFQNRTKEHQQETQKVGKKSSLLSAVLGIVYEVSVIVLICLVAYIAVFGVWIALCVVIALLVVNIFIRIRWGKNHESFCKK